VKEKFDPMLAEVGEGGTDHDLCAAGFVCVELGALLVLGLVVLL
jgi:hypothetical protein